HDGALLEEELSFSVVGSHHEHAALLARREELHEIRQRHLVDGAAHRARLRGARASLSFHLLQARPRRRRIGGHELADAGADQDAVALTQLGALDLLTVHERPVRRTEILDYDLVVCGDDLRVSTRDHVLDENHIELARSTDDDLTIRW